MNLEHDLRRALDRKDPSSGFDDRVLAKIASGDTVEMPTARGRWSRASLPLAASLMLAVGATYYVQQHRLARDQQAKTEQAVHDVVLALQIASEKISDAQTKVEEITRYDSTNNR